GRKAPGRLIEKDRIAGVERQGRRGPSYVREHRQATAGADLIEAVEPRVARAVATRRVELQAMKAVLANTALEEPDPVQAPAWIHAGEHVEAPRVPFAD